jgi:guanylate kinase
MHNLIIISGPSGSGKSTLIRKLLAYYPELLFSVSHTTRPPRKNEVAGRDYYFISAKHFKKMINRGQFAEWAEVHGHRYGTSLKEIRAKSGRGRTLILDIDVQGARSIKRQFSEAMTIFVIPPGLSELKKRLLQREAHWNADTELRLRAALKELRAYELYDYVVVNDKVPAALADLRCLVTAFFRQTTRNEDKIKKMIRGRK